MKANIAQHFWELPLETLNAQIIKGCAWVGQSDCDAVCEGWEEEIQGGGGEGVGWGLRMDQETDVEKLKLDTDQTWVYDSWSAILVPSQCSYWHRQLCYGF